MSVIYSYPIKSTPVSDDLILISDSASSPQFATKQIKVSTLPFSNNAGSVTSVGIAVPAAFEASAAITTSGTITIGVTGGNVGQYLAHDGTWGTPAGGAANPAGAVSQIQYHDTGGVFGASPNFTFLSDILNVQDTIIIKGDGSSVASSLKFNCWNNNHNVTIVGPDHTNNPLSYSITLPNKIATQSAVSGGRVLEINASGVGNWITTPTGGSGSSYQAGNGIDINTGTTPDTINTGLLTNGGLVFDTAKMKVDLAATAMSGELRAVDGGTGQSVYVVGDLLYAETTTTLGALNLSTNDKILGINNGATAPQWITNLVSQEVVSGYMLIGNGTNAMTQLDTTAKGTIAVGNGTTTTNLAVGTDTYVLTAKSAAATGLNWEAITYPTVNLSTGVTGTLPVGNGGTGIITAVAGTITRGNGTNGLIADTYIQYEGTQKSLKIRGTGNTTPTMSAPLSINDVQGSSGIYEACIGLTPYKAAQGGKAISIGLDGYRDGIIVVRKNANSGAAMIFQQVVSANAQVGSITFDNSATAYNTTSDYRSKENVVEMTGSVDRVKQLKPSRFNFISEPDTKIVDGFLAHEVSSVVPEAIHGEKDAVDSDNNPIYQGIDQSKLVPLLVGAIKELTARIEALEA
jgi:hypothetical protein